MKLLDSPTLGRFRHSPEARSILRKCAHRFCQGGGIPDGNEQTCGAIDNCIGKPVDV